MEISKMKSGLKMRDLYFSKCLVEHPAELKEGEYSADLQKSIKKVNDHEYNVKLRLEIKKDDFLLEVITKAHFLYEDDDYGKEENIINKNTVAIMFPFIRSQVTLLTSQPGMTPILLPRINTARFS